MTNQRLTDEQRAILNLEVEAWAIEMEQQGLLTWVPQDGGGEWVSEEDEDGDSKGLSAGHGLYSLVGYEQGCEEYNDWTNDLEVVKAWFGFK